MKQKQKVSLVIFMGLVLTLLASSENAQAKTDWKNYFSTEESKAIKKMVEKNILDSLENPNKDWKGVIDKKVVGDGVAKRKVYTGTFVGFAQANATEDGGDEGEGPITYYYQSVDVPQIDLDEMPQIEIFKARPEMDSVFGSTTWIDTSDNVYYTSGKVWFHIGYTEGTIVSSAEGKPYKIVVSY